MLHRHAATRIGLLVIALATSGLSGPTAAADNGAVPVLGQWRGASFGQGNQVVLSVHGVRRVPGATLVYWSVGYPDASVAKPTALELSQTQGPSASYSIKEPTLADANVVLLDPQSKKGFTTMYQDAGKGGYIGPGTYSGIPPKPEAGKAYVLWAALPPLPEGMTTATLFLGGRTFFDVPVEEGTLEPQVADTNRPPIVGTGWPKIDQSLFATAGPVDRYIFDYTLNSTFADGALAKRDSATGDKLDLASDVLFAVDKATLTSKAKSAINKAAGQVKDSSATSITVTGHTDSDADDAYNLKLSKARAEAVAKALKPLLPGTVKITTEGKGEKEPIADNKTADGKAQNRRVTITIPKATK